MVPGPGCCACQVKIKDNTEVPKYSVFLLPVLRNVIAPTNCSCSVFYIDQNNNGYPTRMDHNPLGWNALIGNIQCKTHPYRKCWWCHPRPASPATPTPALQPGAQNTPLDSSYSSGTAGRLGNGTVLRTRDETPAVLHTPYPSAGSVEWNLYLRSQSADPQVTELAVNANDRFASLALGSNQICMREVLEIECTV